VKSIYRFCVVLVLIFHAKLSIAQEGYLNGEVKFQEIDRSGVAIQNVQKSIAGITDIAGQFRIKASVGDTIVFSSIQLKQKELVVDEAMLKAAKIFVPLEMQINRLEGVTLSQYKLTGNPVLDTELSAATKIYDAQELGLPNADVRIITQSERMLHEATTGGGIIPLNPILNAISGRTKMLKERIRIDKARNRMNSIREHLNDSLFWEELNIEHKDRNRFLYFCQTDSLYKPLMERGDWLAFREFATQKSIAFKNDAIE
tara:strand:+ start:10663 stop:11439 length:777 start_codon:yes stop_codon:yes gene_type:complete